MSDNKELSVYQPGEYFDVEKAQKLPSTPLSIFDVFTIIVTSPALGIIPLSLFAGDFVAAGLTGAVTAVLAVASSTQGKKDRMEYQVAQLQKDRVRAVLPKGLSKSLLPFGARLFPAEFRVETTREIAEESINRSFSRNHSLNLVKTSYVVKTVKGKFKYVDVSAPDPRESWDKLFKQETGEYLDSFRPGKGAAIYQKMANPSRLDIAVAKLQTNVDKAMNKDTPAWVEEVAKRSF